jgi:hypothetical protein
MLVFLVVVVPVVCWCPLARGWIDGGLQPHRLHYARVCVEGLVMPVVVPARGWMCCVVQVIQV